jgi:prepilin-type N-terminal cleavage/methylation domain-containing protein
MVSAGRGRDRGMTLVEIMVTMIISSIIAGSTFMFFAGQQRIYDTQTKVLNIQQNLWASMEVVARYARASGSGSYECVRPASYYDATADDGSRKHTLSPSDGPLTANLDTRPGTGIRVSLNNTQQWIPPLWIVNNASGTTGLEQSLHVLPETDVFTVAFGNRTSGTDHDAVLATNFTNSAPATPLSLFGTTSGNMFRQWEFVLLLASPSWAFGADPATDRGCTMLQITADPIGQTTLAHDANVVQHPGDIVWNPTGHLSGLFPGSPGAQYLGRNVEPTNPGGVRHFGQLHWVRFFIQQTEPKAVPNLMMQRLHLPADGAGEAEILAEGIEDLQLAFACDTGDATVHNLEPNGVLDEGIDDAHRPNDEWWNNVPGDNLPTKADAGFCNVPTAVRITLVARSLAPDDLIDAKDTGNGPLDIEDHHYGTPRPIDQFRRRVLSTTVYPRNNKPQ